MSTALLAFGVRLQLLAADFTSWLWGHDVGPQPNDECVSLGPKGTGAGTGDPEMHLHGKAGADKSGTIDIDDAKFCGIGGGAAEGFWETDIGKSIFRASAAAAIILTGWGIISAFKDMRGGGTLGKAIAKMMWVWLLAAAAGIVAMIPILFLPIGGRALSGIADFLNWIFG